MNYYYLYVILFLSIVIVLTFVLDVFIQYKTQKEYLEWMVEKKDGKYYVWKTPSPYDWNKWFVFAIGLITLLYFVYSYVQEFTQNVELKKLEESLPASPIRPLSVQSDSPFDIESRVKILLEKN